MPQTPQNANLPSVILANERIVTRGFWRKMRRVVRIIPFAPDLLAAYYCAADDTTPTRVRAVLIGALAYFVIPTDIIPDFIAGLGFTDDATVIATAIGIVSGHIKCRHHNKAREELDLLPLPANADH